MADMQAADSNTVGEQQVEKHNNSNNRHAELIMHQEEINQLLEGRE